MAEGNEEATSWSWGSWINSAKTKSASVFEAVKQDLNELSAAVSNAGAAIGETLKLDEPESTANTVKKSLSSFFGQVTEALIPSLDDDDTEAVLITTDGTITLTGFQKHLAELQLNDETYLKPPEAQLLENYNRWIEVTEQDQFTQNRLAKHLASSEILNEKYLCFVPDQVPHMEFWKRYLFKRAILEDALANAEIAERKARAEVDSMKSVSPRKAASIIQTEQPKKVLSDHDLENTEEKPSTIVSGKEWPGDDFGNVEISEEEQARLLEEYEAEIQERELKKSLIVPLEEKLKLEEAERKEKSSAKQVNQQKKVPLKNQAQNKKEQVKQQAPDSTKKSTTQSKQSKTNKQSGDKVEKPTDKIKRSTNEDDSKDSDESWEKDFDLNEQ
ncbi:BSD domain-containing protein 1-A [Pseudolycoriella hygida]|uniref:BSD domain-containing protein 1-A n=1 Tax=Pseudolycoriella hygida TaxID=35572 RepID=A0A9Q0S662_9DIPT|nr:BSD domain-containing protein 1-A [Pseudolycoriella hygida]